MSRVFDSVSHSLRLQKIPAIRINAPFFLNMAIKVDNWEYKIGYTRLYMAGQGYTLQYIAIHGHTWLDMAIHGYT